MEEYKKISERITVPSLPLCALIAFSTVLSYYLISSSFTKIYSALFFLIITLASTFSCVKRYSAFFKKGNSFSTNKIIIIISFAVIIPLLIFFHVNGITSSTHMPGSIEHFQAEIQSIERRRGSTQITACTVLPSHNTRLTVALLYRGDISFNSGDIIFIHRQIMKINPGTEDWNSSYPLRGIHYSSIIYDDDITVISKNSPGFRERIKSGLNEQIDQLFRKNTAGVIKALFTGNRSSISENITVMFRNAGALHLLAASGLHVGIFAGIPLLLLFFNFRRRPIMLLSLFNVILYLFITDLPVSLLRAALMFSLLVFQFFLYRKNNAFNALMLTGSIIILAAPWEIFSIGFQLSFGATAGIILFYNIFKKSMSGLPSFLKNSMAITASAQLFTTPLIIIHLNQINTISLLSNIIMIPLVTIFMYISLMAIIISSVVQSTTGIAVELTLYIYKALISSAGFFSGFNFNFYLHENYPVILFLFSISLIPLIPARLTAKLKFSPVILSLILCTVYLKQPAESANHEIVISSGISSAVLNNNEVPELTLDIYDIKDIDIILKETRALNREIKIVNIKNGSRSNLLACRRICSDFIIDKCCFFIYPDVNSSLKNLIKTLEMENIIISFPDE